MSVTDEPDPRARLLKRGNGFAKPQDAFQGGPGKDEEEAIVRESEWIDRAKISPRLRRVMDCPCWPDAEAQLMAGTPVQNVAAYIQEARGECRWLHRSSLLIYLGELRAAAPVPWRVAAFGAVIQGEKLHKRWSGRTALLESLWNQVEELNVKLERAHARSAMTGVDDPETLAMIGKLVQVVEQAHEIKKDLGLLTPKWPEPRGRVDVDTVRRVRECAGEAAAAVLHDPIAIGRVLEALRLAKIVAGLDDEGHEDEEDDRHVEVRGGDGAADAEQDVTP